MEYQKMSLKEFTERSIRSIRANKLGNDSLEKYFSKARDSWENVYGTPVEFEGFLTYGPVTDFNLESKGLIKRYTAGIHESRPANGASLSLIQDLNSPNFMENYKTLFLLRIDSRIRDFQCKYATGVRCDISRHFGIPINKYCSKEEELQDLQRRKRENPFLETLDTYLDSLQEKINKDIKEIGKLAVRGILSKPKETILSFVPDLYVHEIEGECSLESRDFFERFLTSGDSQIISTMFVP